MVLKQWFNKNCFIHKQQENTPVEKFSPFSQINKYLWVSNFMHSKKYYSEPNLKNIRMLPPWLTNMLIRDIGPQNQQSDLTVRTQLMWCSFLQGHDAYVTLITHTTNRQEMLYNTILHISL